LAKNPLPAGARIVSGRRLFPRRCDGLARIRPFHFVSGPREIPGRRLRFRHHGPRGIVEKITIKKNPQPFQNANQD
jgi:hypothetical protein